MTVPEPTVAQTIMILRGCAHHFEAHHKVSISDAIIAAAELSDATSRRASCGQAIDLLDGRPRAWKAVGHGPAGGRAGAGVRTAPAAA